MNDSNQTYLIGALLGAVIGATAVLLLTPISGEKARKKVLNGFGAETPIRKRAPVKRKKPAEKRHH